VDGTRKENNNLPPDAPTQPCCAPWISDMMLGFTIKTYITPEYKATVCMCLEPSSDLTTVALFASDVCYCLCPSTELMTMPTPWSRPVLVYEVTSRFIDGEFVSEIDPDGYLYHTESAE